LTTKKPTAAKLRVKMERHEQDLRFFKYQLERENNPFRRNLVLREIARVEQQILDLMRQERDRINRENCLMEEALEIIRKREEQKKK